MKMRLCLVCFTVLLALMAAVSACALELTMGTPTPLTSADGTLQATSTFSNINSRGAYVGAGLYDRSYRIRGGQIYYDFYNTLNSGLDLLSWTIYFDPSVAAQIIGAATPIGYVDGAGIITTLGGQDIPTVFNAGFGTYTYNTGAPWTIDFRSDHITFSAAPGVTALPNGTAVGVTTATPKSVPEFRIFLSSSAVVGMIDASAWPRSANVPLTGKVLGLTYDGPPVSEPSAALAVLCGLGGLSGILRRFKK